LKATKGHATRNVLKRCQSVTDGAHIPKTPSFSWYEPITPNLNPSLDSTPSKNDGGEKLMTKSKMPQNQFISMTIVAS
jgi:hypothetical protein